MGMYSTAGEAETRNEKKEEVTRRGGGKSEGSR